MWGQMQKWSVEKAPVESLHSKLIQMKICFLDLGIVKGILHQKNFYRLNLIFWIVMGCGIARFGRRGLKTTET